MPEVQPSPAQRAPRVLVVEDDVLVRAAIAEQLRTLGVTVVEAESADEALSCLVDGSFDLVFSDVQMPGSLDGAALARQLRESHPGLPVILTSGTATPRTGTAFLTFPNPTTPQPLRGPS
jgi:two-component system, response regulator PdtaR